MSKREIKIGGFGGQGVIMAGYVIGKAASIYDGKNATLTQSYGPESRGGACAASVVIDEAPIDFPQVLEPDVVVVMSQEAYTTYARNRPRQSLLLVEEDLVELKDEPAEARILKIPATRFAEELGRKIVTNMVMLGFVVSTTGVVSPEAAKQAVATTVPKGTEKLNLNAFERGYQHGLQVLKADEKR
jgi:2-oxoglutarate ferredoxin oxidoreductase subunit gamma